MSTFNRSQPQSQLQCQSGTARLSTRIPRLSSTRIPRLSSTRTPGFVTVNSKPSVVHPTQIPPSPIETGIMTTSSAVANQGMILKHPEVLKIFVKF